MVHLTNPFNLNFEEFQNLNWEGLLILYVKASGMTNDLEIKIFVKHPSWDWILMAFSPGNVIAAGPKEHKPTDKEIYDVAKKIDAAVFLCVRE